MAKRLTVFLMIFIIIACLFAVEFRTELDASARFKTIMVKHNSAVKFGGTFIQWWLFKDWDGERWLEEFEILKEAGLEYVVIMPTAFYSEESKTTETIYPTEIDGFKQIGKAGSDPLELCFQSAKENGLKVFLGMNFSEDWWSNRGKRGWITARMEEGNLIADELWQRYKQRYPENFWGWYWMWEVDNLHFRTYLDFKNSKKLLSDVISIQLQYLKEKNMRLPVMFSPYMDSRYSTAKGYAQLWEYVFQNSGIASGDIFCPQDSVGSGGLNEKNLVKWFEHLNKATETIPGLEFWCNIETFDGKDWSSVPISKITGRMESLSHLTSNFMSFSYCHYYSPYTKDKEFP